MGLETVEECIANYYLHYRFAMPYLRWDYETKELEKDIKAWEEGELELDWNRINENVETFHKEYEQWLEKHLQEGRNESDLDYLELFV